MKNKKLLVLVLAAFSASAIGAVGAITGCNLHEHNYEWKSDAESHWQECECGDKTGDPAKHADVKNNETGADGKDGKCDVCDYEIKQVVTFDMQGHGVAPEAQAIDFGATATEPATPADDDAYEFKGWYKDAECETPFDFTAPVNDNVTVYAKWYENTTPGESKKYAFELEVNSDGRAQHTGKLGAKGIMYFSYTAVVDGRYTVSLAPGDNSKKCCFTSDKDTDGAKYGNGQTANNHVYDIREGEKVIITLSCDEELADDALVGIAIFATYNEPLPADSWFAGLYANASYSILFDRSNNITFGDTECAYNYLGGSFDTIYIKHSSGDFKLQRKDDVTFTLVAPNAAGQSNTLTYFAKLENPIDVSKFEGTYKPADANGDNKLTSISIGGDKQCYYVFSGNKSDTDEASYDEEYGVLTYLQYLFTLNIDNDGTVTGINVSGGGISGQITYSRTGDFIPGKLNIESYSEYYGSEYTICDSGASQYWGEKYGDPTIEITNYVKDTATYTVNVVNGDKVLGTYQLKLDTASDGVHKTILVYDETGATLLDTLTEYFVNYVDLPTDGSAATTISGSEFKKDFYHFTVTEAGWYTFNCTDEKLEIYYKLSADVPTDTEYAARLELVDGTATVYLAEGVIVGVKSLHETKPETVSITIGLGTAPKGFADTDPLELNGVGEIKADVLPVGNKLYATFTPAEAGSYMIKVSYGEDYVSYFLLYTVNGTPVGYDSDYLSPTSGWNAISYGNYDYEFTVGDTSPVAIVVNGDKYGNYDSVKITVFKSYKAGATELEFVEGEPVNKVVTATATVSAAGTYLVEDTSESPLTITASTEFTAKVNGVEVKVTNANGTYTATIAAGTDIYVEVSAVVTFSITYVQEERPTFGYFTGSTTGGIEVDVDIYFDEDFSKDTMVLTLGGDWTRINSVTKIENGFEVKYRDSAGFDCIATVTMGANGLYTFSDSDYGSCTLKAYTPEPPAGNLDYVYSGRTDSGNMVTLSMNADMSVVALTINGEVMTNVSISGNYGIYTLTFSDVIGECTATLTEEWDGSFTFSESSFYGTATLEYVED